ncbi:MAG: C45 family peptidase, partial [Chitinophagales bacterium]
IATALFFFYVQFALPPAIPYKGDTAIVSAKREQKGEHFYRLKNCWLRKSDSGLWEEYVEGAPFERGVIAGKLGSELMRKQEVAFVDQIHQLVPNNNYLTFLRYFTRFFNRHLEENVTEEYRSEIYGESLSAPHEFDFLGTPYDRMLNYHAAHDIGHALQSLALVGCTSFAAWNEHSADSSLIIGRNFDFYAGDKFAEDKLVFFCKPESGHPFAMITWGGFLGAVSGMNMKGITVTMNAAKSDIPTQSATPISLLGREILQYAGSIDEAYTIAKKRKTFVSETLMIGSATEHTTALIEKSPAKTVLVRAVKSEMFCANHYQSDSFKNDKNNIENIATAATGYRFERLKELFEQQPIDYNRAAAMLRDKAGLHNANIGLGNEKAMNQLIAHHAVIFEPEKLRMWVSTAPFQLGAFECYDLNKVFADNMMQDHEICDTALTIPADSFLKSEGWKNFLEFKERRAAIKLAIHNKKRLTNEQQILQRIVASNPEYFESYLWCGKYLQAFGRKEEAVKYYRQALTKEVNAKSEADQISHLIEVCSK